MLKTRRLRSLHGGGTSSWAFAPSSADNTMNNPMVWERSGSGGPETYKPAPYEGGGLPGVSTQKGGGGGTHYGFTVGGGLAGGNASYPTNCAVPQSGGSGQVNVPVGNSPPGTMSGGRRQSRSRQSRSRQARSRQARSRQSRSRQSRSRQSRSRQSRSRR